MTTVERFDPLTGVKREDYFEALKQVRHECPVAEVAPGVFYLSRYEDVSSVYLDHETFKNAGGHRVAGDVPAEEKPTWELDEPRHAPVRRLALSALNPRAVAEAEPYVRRLAEQLVDAFAPRGSADLIAELAVPLPSVVIAHMLGFPEKDAGILREFVDNDLSMGAVMGMTGPRARTPYYEAFQAYVMKMIQERRSSEDVPDDIVTRMVRFQDEDGRRFSDTEILAQVRSLISAGNETTTHLVGNLFDLLISRGLYEHVRDHREGIPAVVEEALRYFGPVQYIFRLAEQDAEVHGTPIKAGQKILLGMAAANRDETVYPDAEEFNPERGKNLGHLSFGRGTHLCVGASLARLEAISALNAIMDRIPHLEFAPGFQQENVDFTTMRGLKRVDVVFEPVAR